MEIEMTRRAPPGQNSSASFVCISPPEAAFAVNARAPPVIKNSRRSIMPAENVTGNSEKPRAKQGSISNLRSFAVDDQHHFLRQVFGPCQFATARAEERHQLRREDVEQLREGVFA